jgi:hypothetical protein
LELNVNPSPQIQDNLEGQLCQQRILSKLENTSDDEEGDRHKGQPQQGIHITFADIRCNLTDQGCNDGRG